MSFLLCLLITFVQSYRFLAPDEDLTNNPQCFGAIFDAGSSGTRVYIYQWNCREQQLVPQINVTESKNNKKVTPGLASFANNLDGIQGYLQPLIDFIYEIVPQNVYNYTPIMLGATAGMRVLPINQQNAIIQTVQNIFNNTKCLYNPAWVRVLTGQEEGMYMWMSVYYLLNSSTKNLLTMDLGGASTQNAFSVYGSGVDFVMLTIPPNVTNYPLYAVSFLGYGNDMAREAIVQMSIEQGSQTIQSPCYFQGYEELWDQNKSFNIQGTGNLTECQNLIYKYLNTSGNASINGGFEPPVTNQSVYGTNGIVTMAAFFNLDQFTLPSYYSILQNFTNLSWDEAQQKYADQKTYLSTNYFMSIYVYELIKVGYNIPDSSVIFAPQLINGVTPSWTLAACGYQLAQIDCDDDSPVCTFNTYSSILLSIYILLIGLIY